MKTPMHLGRSELELALFEYQHGVLCFMEAFYRHMESQLVRLTGDPQISAQDCVILHAIRLGERSKTLADIQHFTNRGDTPNIQYGVRKLIRAGLAKVAKKTSGRGTRYELTVKGRALTDEYIRSRQDFIAKIPMEQKALVRDLKSATRLTLMLTGLYDHVSRTEAAL